MDTPGTLDYSQAAERIGVTERWLQRRVQRGEVPHRKLGRYTRFTSDDIEQIVAMYAVRPVPSVRRRSARSA